MCLFFGGVKKPITALILLEQLTMCVPYFLCLLQTQLFTLKHLSRGEGCNLHDLFIILKVKAARTMLRLHRSVLLALIASVTWDCTIAERLRNDEYSYTGIRQSDDLLFSRYVGLRSSSVRASKSGKDDSSPKSSKSSSSKSSKSSYYSSKSSKSTKAQDYMTSMGKSAKASYYVDGSNDFGAPFLPSNGNSNDVVSYSLCCQLLFIHITDSCTQ